jgi:ferredoxin
MNDEARTAFENFLNQHDDTAWARAIAELLPAIHEVDRTATQIWLAFYPLAILRALEAADDPKQLARELSLQGDYYLRDQIDSSHKFLYGHRYWPTIKKAVAAYAESTFPAASEDLAAHIRKIAKGVARETKVDESLLISITAVALMTLEHVRLEAFKRAPGRIHLDAKHAKRTPVQVLRERARDDDQGIFGFLKTVDKKWTVTFDENDDAAKYRLNDGQDLAWGAANDRSRDWRAVDPRRIEGPIPVECRSAACGTCWVGVLGGAGKLSEVARRENTRIKEFGYIEMNEAKPLIRLACQAQAFGAVSIVIPPWNGVYGKGLRTRKAQQSEPQEIEV